MVKARTVLVPTRRAAGRETKRPRRKPRERTADARGRLAPCRTALSVRLTLPLLLVPRSVLVKRREMRACWVN